MSAFHVRRDKAAFSRSYGATGAIPFKVPLAKPLNLTETGMSTSALIAPAAQDEIVTLFVGFELSNRETTCCGIRKRHCWHQ